MIFVAEDQGFFALALDESLVAGMQDEARWTIQNDPTAKKEMPNFLEYIYEGGLKAAKAEAVNIIH